MIGAQVVRMFSAFERGTSPERAARYSEALIRVPLDRLEPAVTWVIEHWEEKSPPSIAKLRQIAWNGSPNDPAQDEAEQERLKVLLYYLMRYSDADFYEFKRAFGFTPTRETYGKLAEAGQRMYGKVWKVPDGVKFTAPDPAWCRAERHKAATDCRESYQRLGEKHGTRLPRPLDTTAEVPF